MDYEVLVQMEHRVKNLQEDTLDIALGEEFPVEREHVDQVAKIHLAILKD